MLRKPPDILITTPESLFLLLTSQAREMLRTIETVILDEVHAVAGTKRGAHLALSLERLDALLAEARPADRPLRDAAPARGDRPLRLGRPPDPARRRRHAQGARPRGRRAGRGHARAGRPAPTTTRLRRTGAAWTSSTEGGAARSGRRSTPSCSSSCAQHRSTIVFVNNRRLAERLALRLNELAEEEIARAHHGSLAREQRVEIEELLKAGRDPVPRRHVVARARDRHGRRRPRDPGREPEVGRARPAADRPRGPRARRGLEGPHLPEVPRRPARVRRRRAGDARGRDRGDGDPAQPARRARAADRRDLRPTTRSRSTTCTSSSAARIRSPTSRARSSRTCSTCSPAATRRTSSPSCGRGSSGTAPPA